MITAREIRNAAAARDMSERIDAMLYMRLLLGEDVEEEANFAPVLRHVDHFKSRVPSLPHVGLIWLIEKFVRLTERWIECCGELLKAGAPWQMLTPTWRFALALIALSALAILPRRIAPLRLTVAPIAKCLYQ